MNYIDELDNECIKICEQIKKLDLLKDKYYLNKEKIKLFKKCGFGIKIIGYLLITGLVFSLFPLLGVFINQIIAIVLGLTVGYLFENKTTKKLYQDNENIDIKNIIIEKKNLIKERESIKNHYYQLKNAYTNNEPFIFDEYEVLENQKIKKIGTKKEY